MSDNEANGGPLLQGVEGAGGEGADPNNRDVGGVHGRDHGGTEEKGPNRDVGGVHGRDSGGTGGAEPGPDRDVGGAHGRDQGQH